MTVVLCLLLNVRMRIEGFEFDSRLRGGESPAGAALTSVPVLLPCSDGRIELGSRAEAAMLQALTREDAQFHFRHIQPGTVPGRKDQPQPTPEAASCLRIERQVK